MYLKSLEIQGFKSFPDKTKLDFERGFTAIVGPNGSGKSNIADAICWVLGEQSAKSLRGAKMEDVIFGGTQKRRATGFSQVALTMDNSDRTFDIDANELTVSRRYYRSGDSEYRINGRPVRLRDVNELFMDTGLGRDGYSVIGQGRIADIISEKSGERREIFEEAAGISKFRYRKEQAERRLEQTQENLLRLKDILKEIEDRLEPLGIQAEKAKQFLSLSDEKKKLEVSIFAGTIAKNRELLNEYEEKLRTGRVGYSDAEEKLEEIADELGELREKSAAIESSEEKLRAEQGRISEEIAALEAREAVLNNDIFHKNQNIERLNLELETAAGVFAEIDEEIKTQAERLAGFEKSEREMEIGLSRLKNALSELLGAGGQDGAFSRLQKRLDEIERGVSAATVEKIGAQSSIEELNERSSDIANGMKARQAQLEKQNAEKAELENFSMRLESSISEEENGLEGFRLKQKSRREKLEQLEEELSAVSLSLKEAQQRSKILSDMEKNMEDFSQSVKTVMKLSQRGRLDGIHGPVSKIIGVPALYATAIETALASSIQNIVVDTEENAKQAIRALQQERAGRATFLPISSVGGSALRTDGLEDYDGYVGVAMDLIDFEDKYSGVIAAILGRVVVCEDLDSAVYIAKKEGWRFKAVSLDGQVVNAGGSMTGGSQGRNSGILNRRAEIEKLDRQAAGLKEEQNALSLRRASLSQELSRLEAEIRNRQSSVQVLREDRLRAETQLHGLDKNIKENEKQLLVYAEEAGRVGGRLEALRIKAENAAVKLENLFAEKSAVEEELRALETAREELRAKQGALNAEISDCRTRLVLIQKDEQNIRSLLESLNERKSGHGFREENIRLEAAKLNAEICNIKLQIDQNFKNMEELRQNHAEKGRRLARLLLEKNELEANAYGLREAEREWLGQKGELSRELTRLEERRDAQQAEYDRVAAELWDEYEMTVSEALAAPGSDKSLTKIKALLAEVKNKIRALGSVNVAALEEFEEVRARYEFMSAQCADVEKTRQSLLDIIAGLTKEMREIFTEKFGEINQNFGEIFKELFGGGSARLELSGDSDVLKSGIEIHVQPPGKIIKNLSALSGGEQAFVAIAIYFAILKVRPAPFCLLDEIEAALDEVNVVRFAGYIRRMTDKSQFIAISHRRGTMEEADTLYGVTMQEEGVSKLLKLQVSEAERQFGLGG
ncbi:MAG: chromosome segregation protein SMC [Oscillospiraceae bacterium]|jgi:chromosome segregation protein|nr:chromosome segregation protein SMC [Oscillospiraceae bacterium]